MKSFLRILLFGVPLVLAVELMPLRLALEAWVASVIIFGFLCSDY